MLTDIWKQFYQQRKPAERLGGDSSYVYRTIELDRIAAYPGDSLLCIHTLQTPLFFLLETYMYNPPHTDIRPEYAL